MSKLVIALVFLGLNFYIYQFMASDEVIPTREAFDTFPLQVADWLRARLLGAFFE